MTSNKIQSKNIYNFKHTPNFILNKKFKLENGKFLNSPNIAYKTYGKLNKKKSNAILVCHALTGDQYASGTNPITNKKGWWNDLIGIRKVFDTNSYYIISCNVLDGLLLNFIIKLILL